MRVLAIDPGNIQSGYALIDADTCQPIEVGKIDNELLRDALLDWYLGDLDPITDVDERPPGSVDHIAIEMVASYGMAVGKEVFETCVWIGRYAQLADVYATAVPCDLVYRRDVKLHHCGSVKAKDSNIAQALIDRFAPGQPNRGKGTKAAPGWFHGFAADMWQAYALAVLIADRTHSRAGAA
jgi:hypothetical protein